ncbi:hypothetical protein B0H14DRAFT_2571326 [Mycena olivaceomarginata]|nr:hypothetical protein B0H14DRAFT_2571326 [Mycena olivaceomarginata]
MTSELSPAQPTSGNSFTSRTTLVDCNSTNRDSPRNGGELSSWAGKARQASMSNDVPLSTLQAKGRPRLKKEFPRLDVDDGKVVKKGEREGDQSRKFYKMVSEHFENVFELAELAPAPPTSANAAITPEIDLAP